jgi:serine/threonine protein kinase
MWRGLIAKAKSEWMRRGEWQTCKPWEFLTFLEHYHGKDLFQDKFGVQSQGKYGWTRNDKPFQPTLYSEKGTEMSGQLTALHGYFPNMLVAETPAGKTIFAQLKACTEMTNDEECANERKSQFFKFGAGAFKVVYAGQLETVPGRGDGENVAIAFQRGGRNQAYVEISTNKQVLSEMDEDGGRNVMRMLGYLPRSSQVPIDKETNAVCSDCCEPANGACTRRTAPDAIARCQAQQNVKRLPDEPDETFEQRLQGLTDKACKVCEPKQPDPTETCLSMPAVTTVFEAVPGGDLSDFDQLLGLGVQPHSLYVRRLYRQVLLGALALHKAGVIARDFKGPNVALKRKITKKMYQGEDPIDADTVKVADFGVAFKYEPREVGGAKYPIPGQMTAEEKSCDGGNSAFCQKCLSGTPNFMAPELIYKLKDVGTPGQYRITCEGIDPYKTDVYSIGIMMWRTASANFVSPRRIDRANPQNLGSNAVVSEVQVWQQQRYLAVGTWHKALAEFHSNGKQEQPQTDDKRASLEEALTAWLGKNRPQGQPGGGWPRARDALDPAAMLFTAARDAISGKAWRRSPIEDPLLLAQVKKTSKEHVDAAIDIIAHKPTRDILRKMLNEDPDERPTVEQLLQEPYFNGDLQDQWIPIQEADGVEQLGAAQHAVGQRVRAQHGAPAVLQVREHGGPALHMGVSEDPSVQMSTDSNDLVLMGTGSTNLEAGLRPAVVHMEDDLKPIKGAKERLAALTEKLDLDAMPLAFDMDRTIDLGMAGIMAGI